MTTEYVSMPGFRHLRVGDIVQIDGGPQIVLRVSDSGAVVEPLARKHRTGTTRFGKEFTVADAAKVSHITGNLPKSLLLYACDDPARAEFLKGVGKLNQQKEDEMKGMVTLEAGDALCYHNTVCAVISVTDEHALLGDMEGREFKESCRMNECFFDFADCGKPGCTVHQRFDGPQRAAFLKNFLATRKPPVAGELTTKPSGDEGNGEAMAKKTNETKQAKAVKRDAPATDGKRHGAEDSVVVEFVKAQRKADPEVKHSALVKAFRATGQSCSSERMAKLSKG